MNAIKILKSAWLMLQTTFLLRGQDIKALPCIRREKIISMKTTELVLLKRALLMNSLFASINAGQIQ